MRKVQPMRASRLIDQLTEAFDHLSWSGVAKILAVFGVLNLFWEVAQLPLYDIWYEATPAVITFAVLHCTAGDVLIGINSAIVAYLIVAGVYRSGTPPIWVLGMTLVVISVGYTAYSEWMNVYVWRSWSYSSLMPTVPPLMTGISPILQWVIVPMVTLAIARTLLHRRSRQSSSSEDRNT
ncbi:MAG: hypothetical protein KDK89_05040 [Alphaproteobacteria bacterium]|nr:hypothetical protein [Alphaproteobacteria bacterium]